MYIQRILLPVVNTVVSVSFVLFHRINQFVAKHFGNIRDGNNRNKDGHKLLFGSGLSSKIQARQEATQLVFAHQGSKAGRFLT
jgi:hypothetical protein